MEVAFISLCLLFLTRNKNFLCTLDGRQSQSKRAEEKKIAVSTNNRNTNLRSSPQSCHQTELHAASSRQDFRSIERLHVFRSIWKQNVVSAYNEDVNSIFLANMNISLINQAVS